MPTKPDTSNATLTASAPEILNTIRSEASPEYRSAVPRASADIASIRSIGNIIMDYQPFQNEFLRALVNRIGRVLITSKLYSNPWAMFKKGLLEYGETVEEIFVNLAKPHQFDPAVAENKVFAREIPDVKAAFHTMNFQKFYKVTVSNDQLRQAFLSWDGITDLISRIIDSLYTGANYDEFVTMKYLIAKMILNGNVYISNIPAVTAENSKKVVSDIKGASNQLEYLSSKYNMAGVPSYTNKNDQFIILNADFDALIDVEVLASAFNMDKAEFFGHRVGVDSFANQDQERLSLLFANDPNYKPFTAEQIATLQNVPAVILDRDWFMVFDNFYNFTQQYNGEGLYWNYWYHCWKTFSASPFANAIAFSTTASTVTAVAVSPTTATVAPDGNLQITATVTGTGVVPKSVTWAVSGNNSVDTVVTSTGMLYVGKNETAATVTVTATSVFDPTKSANCTVTVTP